MPIKLHRQCVLSIIVCFMLMKKSSAQELPKLLKSNSPSFSYMECLNKLPKKKDRHCNRYDFSFKIENDTLYVIETKHTDVDKKESKELFSYYYKIRLKDIYLNESLAALKWDKEIQSIKDMDGNTQTRHSFTIHAIGSNWIHGKWWGGKFVEERMSKCTFYSDSYSDSKAFLEYFKGKSG